MPSLICATTSRSWSAIQRCEVSLGDLDARELGQPFADGGRRCRFSTFTVPSCAFSAPLARNDTAAGHHVQLPIPTGDLRLVGPAVRRRTSSRCGAIPGVERRRSGSRLRRRRLLGAGRSQRRPGNSSELAVSKGQERFHARTAPHLNVSVTSRRQADVLGTQHAPCRGRPGEWFARNAGFLAIDGRRPNAAAWGASSGSWVATKCRGRSSAASGTTLFNRLEDCGSRPGDDGTAPAHLKNMTPDKLPNRFNEMPTRRVIGPASPVPPRPDIRMGRTVPRWREKRRRRGAVSFWADSTAAWNRFLTNLSHSPGSGWSIPARRLCGNRRRRHGRAGRR